MKSIFDYTIGKQAEDSTSGALCYLLKQQRTAHFYEELKKLFRIPDDNYTCTDQHRIHAGNFVQRIDLLIRSHNNDYLIAVANKLDAGFSYDKNALDQLVSYSNWLASQDASQKKLIVLVPRYREAKLTALLAGIVLEVKPEILCCEDICAVLKHEPKTELAAEFGKFIECHYGADIELSAAEKKTLACKTCGRAFEKVVDMIDALANLVEARKGVSMLTYPEHEFSIGDYSSYGFNFKFGNTAFWLGFCFGYWTVKRSENRLPIILYTEEAPPDKDFEFIEGEAFEGFAYQIPNYESPAAIIADLEKKFADLKEFKNPAAVNLHYELTLTAEEKRILEDKTALLALKKILDIICKVAENMGGFSGTKRPPRFCEEYAYGGFEFQRGNSYYWFGYWAEMAAELNFPVILQKFCDEEEEDENFKLFKNAQGEYFDGLFYPITHYETPKAILEELERVLGQCNDYCLITEQLNSSRELTSALSTG